MTTAIIGKYNHEGSLISALKQISAKNIEINEVFTPYPVHEVFKILKKKTGMPFATFGFALFGLAISYTFIYWTAVYSYPLIYGGKPLHSIPSFIIIGFVSMISMAILLSFITFLVRTRLYPAKKPIIHDMSITDDGFVVLINKKPEMSPDDVGHINTILKENGATEVFEKQLKH